MVLEKSKSLKEQEKKGSPLFVESTNEDPVSPFNTYFRNYVLEEDEQEELKEVKEIHDNRSDRAKKVDKRYNAPIPEELEKWKEQPDRYDLTGIDTIPKGIRRKRASRKQEKLKEKGIIDEVKEDADLKGALGEYSPKYSGAVKYEEGKKQIALDTDKPRTRAHELGHAIDFERQERIKEKTGKSLRRIEKFRDKVIGDKERTKLESNRLIKEDISKEEREAVKISKRMRGSISNSYRRKTSELIADAISSKIIEPRAFKREAPNLNKKLEKIGNEAFEGEIF